LLWVEPELLLFCLDCKEPLLDWELDLVELDLVELDLVELDLVELDLVELDLVELDFCLDFYQKIQSCQFCG